MQISTTLKISPVNVEERAKLDIRPGTTVRVYLKIQEKGKTRLQAFEGMVIGRRGGIEPGAAFTVRKVASGVGMEKIFPLYSPNIEKIEIIKRSKVRRAKLYYIREKAKKEVRRRMKQLSSEALGKREGQEAEARSAGDKIAEEIVADKEEQVIEEIKNEEATVETPPETESAESKDTIETEVKAVKTETEK